MLVRAHQVGGSGLRVQPLEWAVLALTIAVILALEAVNSAIEALVDLVSPDYHELARIAKDCAAGALLFAVLGALGVAAAIFGPPPGPDAQPLTQKLLPAAHQPLVE